MSKQSRDGQAGDELPPGWTWAHATTADGHRYLTVWRAFPDATAFEYGCAMAPPVDWLQAEDAVARVRALLEARRERLDLPEDVFQRCVQLVYPALSEQQRQNPNEILATIAVLQRPRVVGAVVYAPLARRGPGRPAWSKAVFHAHEREAEDEAAPSDRLADVAAVFRNLKGELGIEAASLRRLRRRFRA